MNIINDLESKGWKILKNEGSGVFAERIETGKLAFFIDSSEKIDDIELMRVWTKKGFHPFTYTLENNQINYYDSLFCESVRFP